eukprot:UN01955
MVLRQKRRRSQVQTFNRLPENQNIKKLKLILKPSTKVEINSVNSPPIDNDKQKISPETKNTMLKLLSPIEKVDIEKVDDEIMEKVDNENMEEIINKSEIVNQTKNMENEQENEVVELKNEQEKEVVELKNKYVENCNNIKNSMYDDTSNDTDSDDSDDKMKDEDFKPKLEEPDSPMQEQEYKNETNNNTANMKQHFYYIHTSTRGRKHFYRFRHAGVEYRKAGYDTTEDAVKGRNIICKKVGKIIP